MTNVLVVEDEPEIADMERDFLEGSGFAPYVAGSGEEAMEILKHTKIDAIILDIMLPGEDGFSLCRRMREATNVPIIFATARTDDADIVRGLGLGADDYIVKPFRGTVLIAHLKAQLAAHERILGKKTEQEGKPWQKLTMGNLTVIPKLRQVIIDGKRITLTGKEFDLLFFLAKHPNEVFSKEELFSQVWSSTPMGEPSTVTVHINRLRDKLKNALGREYENIETVWGSGYRFHIR